MRDVVATKSSEEPYNYSSDEISMTSLMKKLINFLRSIYGATILDQYHAYFPHMAEDGPGFRTEQSAEQVLGVDVSWLFQAGKRRGRACNEANKGTTQRRYNSVL
jgi:hypothetical protein